MPTERVWFIPVLFSDRPAPELKINARETLRALHWVDLHNDWEAGIRKILRVLSPDGRRFTARRYRVGRFRAKVYMGLFDSGDQVFDHQSLQFEYEHKWEPLPKHLEDERDKLIPKLEAEAKANGRVFFNGPAIRLHSFDLNIFQSSTGEELKRPLLQFRPTCWYDYALSNKRLDEEIHIDGKRETIRSLYADENDLETKRNIDWVKLSNILTVSVVLITKDNWTLLSRRTERVDNASGVYAASAAENIHRWKDEPSIPGDFWSQPKVLTEVGSKVTWDYRPLTCPNPFFTVLRAVREEIAKELADEADIKDIKFFSLAWDLVGFNPHLYAILKVNVTIREVERLLDANRGDDSWEGILVPVSFSPSGILKDFLTNENWAEISKGAVLRALVHEYGYKEVEKAFM